MDLRISPKVKTVLLVVLAAAVFGVAGYMITPQSAKSALSEIDKNLQSTQSQLQTAVQAKKQLTAELTQTKQALAETQTRVEELTKAEKAAQTKLTAAEKFVDVLNSRLKEAKDANEPLKKMAEEAQQNAADSRAKAQQAEGQAQKLQQELAAVTDERNQLKSTHKQWQGEKSRLTKALSSRQHEAGDLKRLLGLLEVGPTEKIPPAVDTPGCKPITVKQLVAHMGMPSLVFQNGRELSLHWGEKHIAEAVCGVVTTIDGAPATRSALVDAAQFRPDEPAAAGPWRVAEGQPLGYVALVEMFGRAEGTGGMGNDFTAWWPVGAWGRTATARVVDGVVKEFDGRPVDAATVCELVRHRAEAYRQAKPDVAQAARKYYDGAAKVVARYLQREAVYQARDGWNLKNWHMAPFESVGCWIGSSNVSAGAVTVRAAVQCNWVAGDGQTRPEQRYVVVTLAAGAQGFRQVDYATFQPRNPAAD